MKPALLLDRDGVVNEMVWYASSNEWEAPRSAAEVELIPGAAEAIHRAASAGWTIVFVSNQPSFAKGKCSLHDLEGAHERVLHLLGSARDEIDGSFLCFHHPQSVVPGYGLCTCRKPSPGLLTAAAEQHSLDLRRSWMVGDSDSDVEAGRAVGCRTAMITYPNSDHRRGRASADVVCGSLAEFVGSVGAPASATSL